MALIVLTFTLVLKTLGWYNMSDEESQYEDFRRGEHDTPEMVHVTAVVYFSVVQTSPDGETVLAEEEVYEQLDYIQHVNPDIFEVEIIHSEVA